LTVWTGLPAASYAVNIRATVPAGATRDSENLRLGAVGEVDGSGDDIAGQQVRQPRQGSQPGVGVLPASLQTR
jgi:hypothetical protein